jgi:hypothetical protein
MGAFEPTKEMAMHGISRLICVFLASGAVAAQAGDDAKTAVGSGVGAAAGTAIGQSVGGKSGAVIGGAVGGAVGAAATTKGDGKSGAVIGGAIGGATGAAVGQSAGGKSGAVIGAGVGAAAGASIGKDVTEKKKTETQGAGPAVVRVDDSRDEGHGKKNKDKHKKHPPGHAYGHDKHDRD